MQILFAQLRANMGGKTFTNVVGEGQEENEH